MGIPAAFVSKELYIQTFWLNALFHGDRPKILHLISAKQGARWTFFVCPSGDCRKDQSLRSLLTGALTSSANVV